MKHEIKSDSGDILLHIDDSVRTYTLRQDPPMKSRITIGDFMHIEVTKKFNIFHKFMHKVLLGWKVEDIIDNKEVKK